MSKNQALHKFKMSLTKGTIYIVCLCSLVSIVLCACVKNTNSEANVTHISDGLESEYEWNSPEIDKLRDRGQDSNE